MTTFAERYRGLRRAQKVPKGVPAYMLYVNRPAGRVIAASSPRWVTPNVITITGAVLTFGALLLLWVVAPGTPVTMVSGVALLIAFALDSADGQLSRLRGGGSPLGEWLDHVIDAVRTSFVHMTVAVVLVKLGYGAGMLAWPGLFVAAATAIYAGGILMDKVKPNATATPTTAAPGSPVRSVLMLPVDYGVLCALFILMPWPELFVPCYAVLAAANGVFAVAYVTKWVRELRGFAASAETR